MRSPRLLAATAIVAGLLLAACGGDDSEGSSATTAATTIQSSASSPGKPVVQVPATTPTELQVTDLVVGTGPAAKPGDMLLMHYVGVRTADGTEFDNSYDRGSPLNVPLGAGKVIAGWDEGLVGIQQGGRRQLDIPADLAYGDNPPEGSPIQPGDALTFVVDAVEVISTPDPADRPDVTVTGAPNVAQVQTVDLVAGTVDELVEGDTAVAYLTAYRADTGEELLSSWDSGAFEELAYAEGQTIPGLYQGLGGMRVGGRRQITIPFELAFGADGNPDLGAGLPPSVDLVLVVELFGTY